MTAMNCPAGTASHPFIERATGSLAGILMWDGLDQVWQQVYRDADAGWYWYRSGELPPTRTLGRAALARSIGSLNDQLRKSHARDYCGIVYVDSLTEPTLVKVFDPESLTSLCNIYGKTPLHGWIISRLKPVNLKALDEADADFQRHAQGRYLPRVPEITASDRRYADAVAQTLDARRMGCPLPIVNTCRALKRLAVGQVLEVVTIEPGALNDIDYICGRTGGRLVALEQASYGHSFFIRKT